MSKIITETYTITAMFQKGQFINSVRGQKKESWEPQKLRSSKLAWQDHQKKRERKEDKYCNFSHTREIYI